LASWLTISLSMVVRRESAPEPEVEVDAATAAAMGAELLALWQQLQHQQAKFTHRLRNFDLAHAGAATGALTTAAYLRDRLHMSANQAAQQVMLARQLDALPETAKALAAGEISYQHAAVIASCARKLGAEVVAPHEQTLVDCAKEVDPFSLGRVTEHLEHCVDPDGSLGFFEQQHERRTLQLHRHEDGMYTLRGIFDREGGALIATGLDALMKPGGRDDFRSAGQRRADALVGKFRSGAESPQLTVITELRTLKSEPGAPAAELRDQLTIPSEVVRRLACDCSVQFGHVCADGHSVQLSELQRLPSPKQRRELDLRDGGCTISGCQEPPERCEAHHLQHWADGGKTNMANLALVCWGHHSRVHEGGHTIVRDQSGEIRLVPP
jgi:uncharacterized protein DUF222/HNH endonuclease